MLAPAYDLATLERARQTEPLHVDHGLALTRRWVARAEAAVHCVRGEDARRRTPGRALLALPGQRAALRVALDNFQRWVDEHPDARDCRLVAEKTDAAGDLLWWRDPVAGCTIGIERTDGALVGQGDRLLAVRRFQHIYVLVVRAGTVMAAIKGRLAPGGGGDDESLPPHVRPYRGGHRRH